MAKKDQTPKDILIQALYRSLAVAIYVALAMGILYVSGNLNSNPAFEAVLIIVFAGIGKAIKEILPTDSIVAKVL